MAKYIKGLNKDAAPIDQPEGSYRYAKNVLLNETAGAISNEPGTQVQPSTLLGTVIGTIETTDDKIIIYTVDDNGRSRIYLFDSAGSGATFLILTTTAGNVINGNDVDLKFDKKHPIEGTYKIDPNGDLIVYWTDNFNPPRSLNITRQQTSNNTIIYGVDPIGSPNKNYIDRLNLFPHSGPVPRIAFDRIANGGALKSGTYTLFLAYVDENFTQTNFVSYSLAVPIVEDDESVTPIERYDGCEPDTQTGKSIVWEVDNLNTDYEFLRPIVVHRSLDKDGSPAEFAFKLNDLDISAATASVTFSGLEGYQSSSVDEAIIDTVSYDTAKTVTQLDSVLYLGNLTGNKDIGYQKYANFISLEAVAGPSFNPFDPYELTADNLNYGYIDTDPYSQVLSGITRQGGFRDVDRLSSTRNAPASNPEQVFNRRSYFRDEVYAFYIAFILNDGSMSYAYHIPGRSAKTDVDGGSIRKVGTNNPIAGSASELDSTADPDLTQLTQGQGQLFHFHDFSIFGTSNTNFWHNKNEFYPNTDDYLMIDANDPDTTVEDLRGSNVRHHHMPCNTNSDMRTIVSNNSSINEAVDETTTVYYFYWGDLADSQSGLNETQDLHVTDFSANTSAIDDTGGIGWGDWEDGSEDLQDAFGDISTWTYQVPTAGDIANGNLQGYFLWRSPGNINSGFTTAEVQEVLNNGDINLNQTNSGGGVFDCPCDQLNTDPNNVYGYFVWQSTTPAVDAAGSISQEVRPLGVRLDDIKIPKSIADKVQGFKIYYAERKHSNRRIIGQDVLKKAEDLGERNISGCEGESGNGSIEEFILSPGALRNGPMTTATFHDFYLLHRKNSLVPATHTSEEYTVSMFSIKGPGHTYDDVDENLTPLEACQYGNSYVTAHLGGTYGFYTGNTLPFFHFPIREKCKTYLNGDSIYDGRGIGFGKRIFNIGGETSILLGFKPTRQPVQALWPQADGGVFWHDPIPGSSDPFSYEAPSSPPVLKLHNLHAFKTDMYLSFDTQELVWTGFEVVGDELDNYTVEDDNTSTPGATHQTGNIFGGDTFICRHGYRITHRPAYQGTAPYDHKSLIYVISESTDNINFRHETDVDSTYFPGSPAKKLLDIKANIDLTKKDNMKYDESFSLGVADIKPAIPYPLREADPSIFQTRVQRSAKADNTSLIDNYRVFLALQFKDLPRNRGSLHRLITLNNLLYLHTQDSLFRTKGKQSLQMSDGTESFVGSGDIFAQEPDELIQTKFGYGGTQSQWVSIVTKHGYFCMDYRNRRVFLMKDQLYDIGKTGLESWFQDNIPYALEQHGLPIDFDNPIVGIGFNAMYDERYDRILLTKRDLKPTAVLEELLENANDNFADETQTIATYDETLQQFVTKFENQNGNIVITPIDFTDDYYFTLSGWTVSYNVESNVWASFHDYIPYKYTRIKDTLVSFNEGNNEIWMHKSEENRGSFYAVDYATEFEFIYNAAKDSDKIFYSFEYTIDVTDEHAPTIDGGKLRHDHGFNSFYVYTTHQLSGESPIEYMINTRRVGNEWKINKFRDLADLQNNQQLTYVGPAGVGTFTGSNFGVTSANVAGTITTGVTTHLANTSMFNVDGMTETINAAFINAAKSWETRRKFRDKWVGIRLKYDNVSKKLINLYSTNVAAKKFYR